MARIRNPAFRLLLLCHLNSVPWKLPKKNRRRIKFVLESRIRIRPKYSGPDPQPCLIKASSALSPQFCLVKNCPRRTEGGSGFVFFEGRIRIRPEYSGPDPQPCIQASSALSCKLPPGSYTLHCPQMSAQIIKSEIHCDKKKYLPLSWN